MGSLSRLASEIVDVLHEYFRVIAVACGLVCRGRAAGATPVTWRYTRYVALHPNRRGVMPTDRVHCPSEQVKAWSVCAESTVSGRGEGCLALYPQPLVRVAGYPQGFIVLMISTRGAARIHV